MLSNNTSDRGTAANEKARIKWIDLTRVIAIFCVVLCHTVGKVYPLWHGHFDDRGIVSHIIAVAFFSAGRLGVPLFLFVSGYLLLDRDYDMEHCKKFWRINCFHLWIWTGDNI